MHAGCFACLLVPQLCMQVAALQLDTEEHAPPLAYQRPRAQHQSHLVRAPKAPHPPLEAAVGLWLSRVGKLPDSYPAPAAKPTPLLPFEWQPVVPWRTSVAALRTRAAVTWLAAREGKATVQ